MRQRLQSKIQLWRHTTICSLEWMRWGMMTYERESWQGYMLWICLSIIWGWSKMRGAGVWRWHICWKCPLATWRSRARVRYVKVEWLLGASWWQYQLHHTGEKYQWWRTYPVQPATAHRYRDPWGVVRCQRYQDQPGVGRYQRTDCLGMPENLLCNPDEGVGWLPLKMSSRHQQLHWGQAAPFCRRTARLCFWMAPFLYSEQS